MEINKIKENLKNLFYQSKSFIRNIRKTKRQHCSTFKFPYRKNHPCTPVIKYNLTIKKGNHLVDLYFSLFKHEPYANLCVVIIQNCGKPRTKLNNSQWKCLHVEDNLSFFDHIGHTTPLGRKYLGGAYDNHIPFICNFVKEFFPEFKILNNEIHVKFYGLNIKKYKKIFISSIIPFLIWLCLFVIFNFLV